MRSISITQNNNIFTCSAAGYPTPSYQWAIHNGTFNGSVTSDSITSTSIGYYSITCIANNNGTNLHCKAISTSVSGDTSISESFIIVTECYINSSLNIEEKNVAVFTGDYFFAVF